MRFRTVLLIGALALSAASARPGPAESDRGDSVETILFGSCAHQLLPQDFWTPLVAEHADLFVFLGDNVYADTRNPRTMRAVYRQLGRQPGWQALKERTTVLSIWDDHDYGENDAGADYPMAAESEQIFLDFYGVPASSARRLHPGIYGSEMFGAPGQRVQVILLDTRRFRGPWKKPAVRPAWGKYIPNADPLVPMLGETQWLWLERELRRPAELRIIASGIQVIPEEHGWETWGNLPSERERLFRTIRESGAERVVLLSGDRHLAEFSRLPANDPLGVGYPLWEATSSSLNRGINRPIDEPNRYRVGDNFTATNYGRIRMDWSREDPSATLEILDTAGSVVRSQVVSLSSLRRKP